MPADGRDIATPLRLTRTRLLAGRWEGVLTRDGGQAGAGDGGVGEGTPRLAVTHLGVALDGTTLTPGDGPGVRHVAIPVPAALIADGVQTFVIADADTGAKLDSFCVIAGDALDTDIRAEVDLLRAELDMLKRAFRRHCVETA